MEGSRHVLGRISARSRRNFASAGDEVLREATDSPKGAQRKPKGAKRRHKGAQRQPKGAKREAKGSPGGRKTAPKTIKNRSCIWKAVWDAPEVLPTKFFLQFWLHFASILEAEFGDFSCYLLASFFDRFLKASGGILGGILAHFGRSFWLHFQTLRKKAHPTNSLEITMQIKGRAPGKAIKKRSKIEEKTIRKHTWEKHAFFMNFGIILGGFWHHFGSPNAFKNRVKFWMRFWMPNLAS